MWKSGKRWLYAGAIVTLASVGLVVGGNKILRPGGNANEQRLSIVENSRMERQTEGENSALSGRNTRTLPGSEGGNRSPQNSESSVYHQESENRNSQLAGEGELASN